MLLQFHARERKHNARVSFFGSGLNTDDLWLHRTGRAFQVAAAAAEGATAEHVACWTPLALIRRALSE